MDILLRWNATLYHEQVSIMSRITNARWNPGTTITKTGDDGVDTKFAAFETATANINEQNVRSEGIDVGNIYSNPAGTGTSAEAAKSIAIKLVLSGEKTSTTVVNNATGTASPGAIEVLPAANIALSESFSLLSTDILRVYYTVTVGGWPAGFRPQNTTVNLASAGIIQRDRTGGLFWLVWPEVATGGTVGSPSGWTRLGSQPDPDITASTGQISMATSTTVMPIPHFMYTSYLGTGATALPRPIPPVVGSSPDLTESQARASYSRGCFATGALTITGVRLMMKGLYHMTTGGPADSRFDFASACSSYNGTGAAAPPLQKVNITYSSMAVIAMRQN